jgi:hypothetical protein
MLIFSLRDGQITPALGRVERHVGVRFLRDKTNQYMY